MIWLIVPGLHNQIQVHDDPMFLTIYLKRRNTFFHFCHWCTQTTTMWLCVNKVVVGKQSFTGSELEPTIQFWLRLVDFTAIPPVTRKTQGLFLDWFYTQSHHVRAGPPKQKSVAAWSWAQLSQSTSAERRSWNASRNLLRLLIFWQLSYSLRCWRFHSSCNWARAWCHGRHWWYRCSWSAWGCQSRCWSWFPRHHGLGLCHSVTIDLIFQERRKCCCILSTRRPSWSPFIKEISLSDLTEMATAKITPKSHHRLRRKRRRISTSSGPWWSAAWSCPGCPPGRLTGRHRKQNVRM